MLKSVAGRQVPFNIKRLPGFTRLSRRVGLRTIGSIGGKAGIPRAKSPITTYFESGFEPGDYSEWDDTGGPPVIDSATKHDGDYSSRSEGDLFYAYYASQDMSGFGLPATYYIHGWVMVDSFSADRLVTDMILGAKNGLTDPYAYGGIFFAIRRTAADTYYLGVYDAWNFDWYSAGVELELDIWSRIELGFVRHASNGSFELFINGVSKVSESGMKTDFDYLHAGAGSTENATGHGSRTLYVDTIEVVDP